ncbi:MAG TPA: Gfo/Idh/MocA family oxidoreductase [Pirellulales bacterium]|nr:Gfo/Idh/MocA family oxidoreductase [Pirellulales bacterium]
MSIPNKPLAELRVAIVGYGSIGRRHCDNLERLGVSRRIVVRRAESANPAFTPPPDVTVVHSISAAIEHGLDLAIICNPTAQHVASARQFIAAGVPVLIEKPLAHRLADAEELLEENRRTTTPAGMAYSMRYHPAYALAREHVQSGRLGRVLYAKAWFETYLPDWHPWEDYRLSYAARRELGGGVLPTLDHEIDFLNGCLGPPLAARGMIARSGTLELDASDIATLSIEYGGGVLAAVALSLCRRRLSRGFEFIGSDATVRYDFDTARLSLQSSKPSASEVLWDGSAYDFNELYLEMLRDVLSAVAESRASPVPLQSGVETLKVIGQIPGAIEDAQSNKI